MYRVPMPGSDVENSKIRERLAATGKQFFCICFSARSGSTLLCNDMTRKGLGAPTEYFQLPESPLILDQPLADYLVELVDGSPGAYFGLKVAWQQAYELTKRLRDEGDPGVSFPLGSVFPDLAYIHVVRRDKIGQAVSSWRAVSSDIWHWPVGASVDPGRPEYDFETIKLHFVQMVAEEWLWKSHFEQQSIVPLTIHYEDYLADRAGHLRRIAEFLGAPESESTLEESLHLMRDGWTEQIVQLVQADLEAPHHPYWVQPGASRQA
jgi:trehalose 2-sulfotransferase